MDRYWSVTTIIGVLDKPALIPWAVGLTAEYAIDNIDSLGQLAENDREGAVKLVKDARWRKTKAAQMRGTEFHEIAEAFALGQEYEAAPELEPYVRQFKQFLADHKPTYEMSEAAVYNPTWKYAGTLDAIAVLDGKRVAIDMKTTDKGPKARSRPPYPEIALQLCAYANAEYVGLDPVRMEGRGKGRYYLWDPDGNNQPLPEVDGAFALVISPEDYQLIPVDIGPDVFKSFLHIYEAARWQNDLSKRVLGPAVTKKRRAA